MSLYEGFVTDVVGSQGSGLPISISKKLTLGKKIANGIPGNPPPVPTSSIFVPCLKLIIFAVCDKKIDSWQKF